VARKAEPLGHTRFTVVFAVKPVPEIVSVPPGVTLAGDAEIVGIGATGAVTTKEVVATLSPSSLAVTVTVPAVAGAGTVTTPGNSPAALVVVVTTGPLDKVSVTTVLAAKPVPVIVSVEPAVTLGSVAVIVGVAASASAVPELVTADAAGITDASGAANTAVRLLNSSAAVAIYATKLLRSEFKVPSSLGDINCCE
jgi:hypothetical protein